MKLNNIIKECNIILSLNARRITDGLCAGGAEARPSSNLIVAFIMFYLEGISADLLSYFPESYLPIHLIML